MYKKYGDEWEKEVMKNSKKTIVEMLRRVAIERDGLEAVEHTLALDGANCTDPECGGVVEVSLTCKTCGVTRAASKA